MVSFTWRGKCPWIRRPANSSQGDVQVQAERVLENVKAILEAAGSGMEHALKVSVFLQDINDFARMNEIYGRYFAVDPPARTTVQVGTSTTRSSD